MQEQNLTNSRDSSTTNRTKTTTTLYDYNDALQTVIVFGKELFGPKFQIFEEDRATILKLLCWFLQDEDVAPEEGLNLKKGVLLTGPVGCGKSAIMKIIQTMCKPSWKFCIKSAQRVALEFGKDGYVVIDLYTERSFDLNNTPITICFDDLGSESNIPNYGIPFNTFAEILPIRYELFVEDKMITHITTNLNSIELEERYGVRLRSRMSEMFNLVAFPKTSPDKRRL